MSSEKAKNRKRVIKKRRRARRDDGTYSPGLVTPKSELADLQEKAGNRAVQDLLKSETARARQKNGAPLSLQMQAVPVPQARQRKQRPPGKAKRRKRAPLKKQKAKEAPVPTAAKQATGAPSLDKKQELESKIKALSALKAESASTADEALKTKRYKGIKRLQNPEAYKLYKETWNIDTDNIAKRLGVARKLVAGLSAKELGISEQALKRLQASYYQQLNGLTPYFTQLANLDILWKQKENKKGKVTQKGPWSSTCNITSLAMAMSALGVTAGDFNGDWALIKRLGDKFAPAGKSFDDIMGRLPDFLQLVVIYRHYQDAGEKNFDKQAKKARKKGTTKEGLTQLLAVAEKFGVSETAGGAIESLGYTNKRIKNKTKRRKKLAEKLAAAIGNEKKRLLAKISKLDADIAKLEESKDELTGLAYKDKVLQEIMPLLDAGGQIVVARPGHYVRLQGFYRKGVVFDDQWRPGQDFKMKWGQANTKGYFSSYKVLNN